MEDEVDLATATQSPPRGGETAQSTIDPATSLAKRRIDHETQEMGCKRGDIVIYPGIGVARLGDSEEYFIGPTKPDTPIISEFRDEQGKIKKQAAQFQLFQKSKAGWKELNLAKVERIEWTVHLANKKSAYFKFAHVLYFDPVLDPKKDKSWYLRNPNSPEEQGTNPSERIHLINDAGEKVVAWNEGQQRKSDPVHCSGGKATFTILHDKERPELGAIRTTKDGHLIVTGGCGFSDSWAEKPIMDFVNNDTWYDDISDGPVKATIVRKDKGGERIEARSSWVVVAPPKYAPTMKSTTTLWDIMEEVAINKYKEQDKTPYPDDGYDYWQHIHPILTSVADASWVNDYANQGHGLLSRCDFNDRQFLNRLNGRNEVHHSPEEYDAVAYGEGSPYFMPMLSGDGGDIGSREVVPATFLSVSPMQYERLKVWVKKGWGNWKQRKDKAGEKEKEEWVRGTVDGTVEEKMYGLNKAALEWSVGGAFAPGIEVSYITRNHDTYDAPFRINRNWKPGDLTGMMAVPWQADFTECDNFWWPAQRPDNVLTEQDFMTISALGVHGKKERLANTRQSWTRNFRKNPEDKEIPRWGDMDMVEHWNNLGFIVPKKFPLDGEKVTVLYEVERRDKWILHNHVHPSSLTDLLQEALKLEMSTIPVYLTAMWSIRTDKFPTSGLSEAQRMAMDAFNSIHRVVVEEMLHATLVGNLLSAYRNSPDFRTPLSYPTHVPHMDDPLIIGLGPLSKESIEAFLRIELPEVREDEEREPDMDFKTIGHFYHTILTKINEGNGDFDDNSCQFPEEGYYPPGVTANANPSRRGEVIRVTDQVTARKALKTIIFQGEGARHHKYQFSHYNQFIKVQEEFPKFSELVGAGVAIQDHPPSSPPPEEVQNLIQFFNAGYYFLLDSLNSIYTEKDRARQLQIVRGEFFLCMKNLLPMVAYLIMDEGFVPSFEISNWCTPGQVPDRKQLLRTAFDKLELPTDYISFVLGKYVDTLCNP